jgi:nucleoside-diphosphate-sugar epimerase
VFQGNGLNLFHSGYVEDIAEAIVLCLEKPESNGEIFNVGHESILTAAQIAQVIADEVDHEWEFVYVPANSLPFDNPFAVSGHVLYDTSKIRALGFRESCTHAGGIRKAVRWMLKHQPEEWGYRKFYRHDPFDYALEDMLLRVLHDRLSGPARG